MKFDDPFEQKLASLRPRELPPEWRAEILARSATAPLHTKLTRPPKWLLAGWGLAWAAVIVLHVMTPDEQPRASKGEISAHELALLFDRSQALNALLESYPNLHP